MGLGKDTKLLVAKALSEDVGSGDITTQYTVPQYIRIKAKIVAKEDMVVCGLYLVKEVFSQIDKNLKCRFLKKEGAFVKKGEELVLLSGKAVSILTAERTALNFLMHLSAIASNARRLVDIASKYGVKVLDTRKTVPGLRHLHKYAVKVGGGLNHRKGLWDQVIIKDNHLISIGVKGKAKFDEAYVRNLVLNLKKPKKGKIEIEVESIKEFKTVCKCEPDIILLDNFGPKRVERAVNFRNRYFPEIKLEASGRINSGNIRRFAQTRVDYISIGSLTHSLQAKDISLEIKKRN